MIIEELYEVYQQDDDEQVGEFKIEKLLSEEVNIVNVKKHTCSCQDFTYRSKYYPKGEYVCKHLRMVKLGGKLISREYCKKTKIEELKVLFS